MSIKTVLEKTDGNSLTLTGLGDFGVVLRSTGFTCCYSCLTLAGLGAMNKNQTIPEGLNVNNIRQLPDEERVSNKKTPEVFNVET